MSIEEKYKDIPNKINRLKTLISKQSDELLNVREQLKSVINEAEKWEETATQKEALREKWFVKFKQSEKNLTVCKTDRATFERQLTELKNKQEPSNSVLKSVYKFILMVDNYLKG